MSDVAIHATGLSKKYRLGIRPASTLRDAITSRLRAGLRGPRGEDLWALKDVSFDIKRHEAVGILGSNGAGKSTLLKILSRITEPTSGRAEVYGRLGALLEVGTGFHSELSGRENIYLNGAILGMRRAEIVRKLDEIIAFSEIGRFIDTPVKHYSSGMYVRLAFAVAAHTEPEILIVDEVLAVGDAAFQAKCLGKMKDVAGAGRTVVFVSHNMRSIRQLCTRVLWMQGGQLRAEGPVNEIVDAYLREVPHAKTGGDLRGTIAALPPDPAFRLEDVRLTQHGDATGGHVDNGAPLSIEIRYEVLQETAGLRVYFDLFDDEDTLLFRSFHDEEREAHATMKPGRYLSKAVVPGDLLAPARYDLRVQAGIYNVRHCMPPLSIALESSATGRYNRAYPSDLVRGKLALVIPWETRREPAV